MTKTEVNGRAVLYVLIAALTVVSPAMTDESVKWPSVAVQAVLSALVALRAFVDKSTSETVPDTTDEAG